MSALWPHWSRLAWLLALPLLLWVFAHLWRRRQRGSRWQSILPPAFHSALLAAGSGRGGRLPWLLLALGWGLALLALLGPSWQHVEELEQRPADPLVVLLQLTPDMLAGDVAPNRLGLARRKVLDLLRERGEAQTAIVVYAGSAHVLVPLSNDLATASNLLAALAPSLMPAPGQRADLAVGQGLGLLAQAGQGQGRLLLVASALSDEERSGIDRQLGRQSPPLSILGIGSADGAPVTLENGELLKDAQGAIVLPRLDSGTLEQAAQRHHGTYQGARPDDSDLRSLNLFDAPHGSRLLGSNQHVGSWADQGYWLLLPLLLVAALAGRRGWLLCLLPLLLAGPHPALAAGLGDLWLRPDQQGQRLLRAGQPAEAARHFSDHRWHGVALFEAGDYAGAAQQFSRGDSAVDHYNRGTALARSGDLDAALQAFDQALARDPGLQPARQNRTLVQALLGERKAAAPAPPETPPTPSSDAVQAAPGSAEGAHAQAPQPAQGDTTEQPAAAAPPSTAEHQAGSAGAGEADATLPHRASPGAASEQAQSAEQQQSLEQWLRQIPDDPAELLRRKFWLEQQHMQDTPR